MLRVKNLNIHITPPAIASALLAALAGSDDPAKGGGPVDKGFLEIGSRWSGVAGVYAGISRGENGEPDAYLVLLDAKPDKDLNWQDAVEWAQGLGDGARLPTRFESALLYAHLRDELDTSVWHWTGTQYSASYAWNQSFHLGYQSNFGKSCEARARAVRRFPI